MSKLKYGVCIVDGEDEDEEAAQHHVVSVVQPTTRSDL
jgi:hypothetical protein